jgi:hypothetical protein
MTTHPLDALRRLFEFLLNCVLAALDWIVARVGRPRYAGGDGGFGSYVEPWPTGRHSLIDPPAPVADDWSPLDVYDRAVIVDRVLSLAGAAT